MEFEKVIRKRASIRSYSDQKVTINEVINAIEAANLAPSPGNLQLLRYIIIENKETKEKIAEACQQDFVAEARFLVLVCSDSKKADIMYDKRAKKYVKHHAGAAIENFLLKITDLGLCSCWIGAFSESMIRSILEIPDEIEIEAVLPIAHQLKSDDTSQKQKYSLDGKIFFEKWKNKFQKPMREVRRSDL